MNALAMPARPRLPDVLHEERDGDDALRLQLRVPPDLPGFDGHFAGTPVVPGVAQIDWALALASDRLGTSLACCGVEALKFKRLLRPADQLALSLRALPGDRLQFAYHRGTALCSTGRCLLEPRDG